MFLASEEEDDEVSGSAVEEVSGAAGSVSEMMDETGSADIVVVIMILGFSVVCMKILFGFERNLFLFFPTFFITFQPFAKVFAFLAGKSLALS